MLRLFLNNILWYNTPTNFGLRNSDPHQKKKKEDFSRIMLSDIWEVVLTKFNKNRAFLHVTAATGAKNQRHESRTDEDVHLYLRTCQRKASIHCPTSKLKQNKCTHKCSKKGNTPRKWWFKSNQSRESTCLTLFALLVTHKEKRQSRMPVNLKKTEFAPAGVQVGSSIIIKKKTYRLKRKLLHSHFIFLSVRTDKKISIYMIYITFWKYNIYKVYKI